MFSKPNNQWSNREGFNFKRHTPTMPPMTKMTILITSVITDSLRLKSQIWRQQHQQCFVINSEIRSYMWIVILQKMTEIQYCEVRGYRLPCKCISELKCRQSKTGLDRVIFTPCFFFTLLHLQTVSNIRNSPRTVRYAYSFL